MRPKSWEHQAHDYLFAYQIIEIKAVGRVKVKKTCGPGAIQLKRWGQLGPHKPSVGRDSVIQIYKNSRSRMGQTPMKGYKNSTKNIYTGATGYKLYKSHTLNVLRLCLIIYYAPLNSHNWYFYWCCLTDSLLHGKDTFKFWLKLPTFKYFSQRILRYWY